MDAAAPALAGQPEVRSGGASYRAGGLHGGHRSSDDTARPEAHIEAALPAWSLAPVVEALQALRGVGLVAAATLMAELGDITRFSNPRQLMAYLSLVPFEHSSGRTPPWRHYQSR
jgi:hypothetical protein